MSEMRPSRRNPSGRGSAGAPHGYGSLIWNHQTALAESRTVHPAEPPARPRCKATEDPCWKCGIGLGAAREKVRVAHALEGLPKISDEFRQGRISFSKVRAMTRVATPANEDELLNIAWHRTASHVERLVSQYRKVKRLEALEAENQRHELRELNWHVDDDGSYVLKARLTPEQGERIVKPIESAMDEEFEERQDVSAERSSPLLTAWKSTRKRRSRYGKGSEWTTEWRWTDCCRSNSVAYWAGRRGWMSGWPDPPNRPAFASRIDFVHHFTREGGRNSAEAGSCGWQAKSKIPIGTARYLQRGRPVFAGKS